MTKDELNEKLRQLMAEACTARAGGKNFGWPSKNVNCEVISHTLLFPPFFSLTPSRESGAPIKAHSAISISDEIRQALEGEDALLQ